MLVAALALVVVVVVTSADSGRAPETSGNEGSLNAKALDLPQGVDVFPSALIDYLNPSRTAENWVTYGTHVVMLRVEGATLSDPSMEQVERGEGVLSRQVRAVIETVIWSSPDTTLELPAEISIGSGFRFYKADDNPEFLLAVAENTSLLIPGYSYVMAIRPSPGRECEAAGDRWAPIGEHATIPVEGGTLGSGELEGRMVAPDEYPVPSPVEDEGDSLAAQVLGGSVDDLQRLLAETTAASETYRGVRAVEQVC